jgi:hypothetical protein
LKSTQHEKPFAQSLRSLSALRAACTYGQGWGDESGKSRLQFSCDLPATSANEKIENGSDSGFRTLEKQATAKTMQQAK